jgi:hypothetical protein
MVGQRVHSTTTPSALPLEQLDHIPKTNTQQLTLQHYTAQQRLLTTISQTLQVGNKRHNRSSTQAKQKDWSRCTHGSTFELSDHQPNSYLSPVEDLLIQNTKSNMTRTHDDGIPRPADL